MKTDLSRRPRMDHQSLPLSFSLSATSSLFPFRRLVGLVVKASASGVEDPVFESRLRRDFSLQLLSQCGSRLSEQIRRVCSDRFTCCYTEIEAADPTFHLTQSQYTDSGPTSLSADPVTPGAWQGSHWSADFEDTGLTRPRKKSRRKRDSNPGSSRS